MEKQKLFEKIFKEHLKVETYSKSIDSLFSPRLKNKINYRPYYQRNYVWDNNKATYFIESILMGTEIPPLIFFDNNNEIEVIDGRQRFETIERFMNNDFSLTKRGLYVLKQLKGSSWDSLAKTEKEIIENFLDAKLRIIEFKLVNEPPLDRHLEDQVKKEIFSRYNSGITPLKRDELDNALYDNDELTNSFKIHFRENPDFKNLIYQTFFKQIEKDINDPPVDKILSFVRRFLVLPSFPINHYSRGTGRTDVLSKLYQHLSDENIGNHETIISELKKKVSFLNDVKSYSNTNNLRINRLSLECFLWGLGLLDLEELDYILDETLKVSVSNYISDNYDNYPLEDSNFSKNVMARYSTTAAFFTNYYEINLDMYVSADDESRERLKELRKHEDTITKLSELETLRLNKPEPAKNSIDDLVRLMTRRRFLVRPSYQRREVINPTKASSIIESILLGITLPAIFIYKRTNGINEVIDGQQRLLTILGFMGTNYINERNETEFSKNHNFYLRKLRILNELNGSNFRKLEEDLVNKIYDFQLYVVEIDENHNPYFDPIDLFIRLNDKPYPIRENSFEMWNSWVDVDIIQSLKNLKQTLDSWFYLKQIRKSNDRDRMENEELLTTLAYIEYYKKVEPTRSTLDVYQKTERINARISTKARISALMQELTESEDTRIEFYEAIKSVKSFVKKLKYVLLDENKTSSELSDYLNLELDKLYKADKESRYFRRTIQDFYFTWMLLESLNFEMVKYHRLEIKKEMQSIFAFIKNIPEEYQENNLGLKEFYERLEDFKSKYAIQTRKVRLTEDEKLQLINEQGNRSSLSEAPVFLGDDIEVDHTNPLALGGNDSRENLGIAHKEENRKKGAKKEF